MKVSPEIRSLVPYVPGKPIEETRRELGLDSIVKLASNENPLGPSPKAAAAMSAAIQELHRYPDASSYSLTQAVSRYYKVPPNWLAFGNGSNELIDLVIRIFCEPGEQILIGERSFVAYKICAQAARVGVQEFPLTSDWRVDLKAIARHLQKSVGEGNRLVFIPNPNNPTGTYVSKAEVDEFFSAIQGLDNVLVVFDEAYNEFVRAEDYPETLDYMRQFPNVVVLRTFSKVFGLAGLRLGVVIAKPETIDLVQRVRNPFNVNTLAQAAAIAALDDQEYLRRSQEVTWQGLDYFYKELIRLGLPYLPSQGNFVLFDTLRDAEMVNQALLKKGVILRPVKNYGLPYHLRMSIGTREENQCAITALEEVLPTIPMRKD